MGCGLDGTETISMSLLRQRPRRLQDWDILYVGDNKALHTAQRVLLCSSSIPAKLDLLLQSIGSSILGQAWLCNEGAAIRYCRRLGV